LYNQIGGAAFRNHFIDCAAHMANGFDFITPAQYTAAKNEWNTYADPLDDNKFIQTYTNTGSGGWFQPVDSLTTNAWSYNTYKLDNNIAQTYTFEIDGDATGTYGGDSYFQGKVLVQNSVTGASYHDLAMATNTEGSLTLNLTHNDTAAYFIIAAMPEVFDDPNATFQLFPYQMRIHAGAVGITETEMNITKYEIGRYNVLGQAIDHNIGGLQFIMYNNGSSEKVYITR
jgi:hypothetical protein